MEVRLRKDAKASNLKVKVDKAYRRYKFSEHDCCSENGVWADDAAFERRAVAWADYHWHLDRYEIAVERESGVQDMNDHDFTHWHNERGL